MISLSQPIVATVGDDIILPCRLEPAVDVVSRAVEWARLNLNPRFVHVRRDGAELLIDQNPSYLGRTSIPVHKLKYGDVSLKLSKLKLSDNGTYRCYIPELNKGSTVQLIVGKWALIILDYLWTFFYKILNVGLMVMAVYFEYFLCTIFD